MTMVLQRQRPARRGTPSYLLVVMTLIGGLAVTQGAFWDNWIGNGKKVNDEASPAAPSEVVKPSVTSAPAGLDMKGVDVHSLINPAAVGHDITGGQCGVYTRGLDGAELTLCVESVVEYGTDIKQINGFLINSGTTALCDLLIQPVVPEGSTLVSFWPDWILESVSDIFLEPGQKTAIGLTLRPGPQTNPTELPRIDIRAFKDCSHSAFDQATGDVTFHLVSLQKIMPQTIEFLASGQEADRAMSQQPPILKGQDILIPQEGQCAIYTKPATGTDRAQATLCVDSVLRWGTDIVQVNGLLLNTGKAPLCTVRMAAEHDAQYLSLWPRWVLQGHHKDNFRPGDSIAVGLTSPARPDGSRPALALENFDICGHPSTADVVRDPTTGEIVRPSPLEVVIVSMDDLFGKVEAKTVAKQLLQQEQKQEQQTETVPAAVEEERQVSDTSAGTKLDASGAVPEQMAIPVGVCGIYRKGEAELALCSDSLVTWGRDVQQLNGFMMNTGNTTVCDIRLKPVLPSATEAVYALWPDWASESSYEVYFNPKQMTAAGMTGPLTETTPYLEIVSFRDCKDPPIMAVANLSSFSTVAIENVQPPPPSEEITSMPVAVPIPDHEGAKGDSRRRTQTNGNLRGVEKAVEVIPEGYCALHTTHKGVLALCVESILHWGSNLVQINTFLKNLSDEPEVDLCDIEVAASGGPQGVDSVWPKWVQEGIYAGPVRPAEVLPVGVVAPFNASNPGNDPAVAVVGFRACSEKKALPVEDVVILPIGFVRREEDGPFRSVEPVIRAEKEQQHQQHQQQPEGPVPVEVGPGRCGQASGLAGFFKMKLCVDRANMWSNDIVQLAGRVENTGNEPICDLMVGHNFEKSSIASSWPTALATGEQSKALLPGDIHDFGFTASPRGLAENVLPMLSVISFRPCGSGGVAVPAPPQGLELMWEGPLTEKVTDLLSSRGVENEDLGEAPQTEAGRRRLAVKKAAPTTMDTIDWDLCGYYTGLDGQSELALCWKDAKSWKDRDAGRVVQTNLILVNTGKLGVCNVTIEIENFDLELGDHYPTNWLDEDGDDMFPSFPGFFAPEQIVNFGAAVPVASGFPEVGIDAKFSACSPPPPKAVAPRNATCTPVSGTDAAAGVILNFCVYDTPKVWTEYGGPRVVMVEGYIENIGKETACNITVDIENFEENQAMWGEWMPTYPYKLSPRVTLKFGANIPFVKGIPKSTLTGFDKCDPL
ncbi:Hypothetical protein NocV09_00600630 [Nannochloropsis oceanica]